MSKNRNKPDFLSLAAREGRRGINKKDGGPFGAVIVRNGKIIARGHNTVLASNDPTRHAEVNAIRAASKKLNRFNLSGCLIYSSTEPCPMCFSAIHWARLSKIVYSTTIADVKRLGFNELAISNQTLKKLGKTSVKLIRTKNDECSGLLSAWKSLKNKRTY
jgi:guanine deaminase